ncbi:MAG: Tetraacyldisaccharide 4'-kinase [Bacteroidetes bacterium ADurb.Bin302]|nr:MAG: Tetraacyldisaccharide 4'-kinase [Bacteroidetes bacterium ADurb.Bin302]
MKSQFFKCLRIVCYPIGWIYGLVVMIRNYLFDAKIIKSTKYKIAIISVGNLTVGGTGKTPHVEYLLHILSDKFNTAMLSRGYKRKSKGLVFANTINANASILGDEAYQVYSKFPQVKVVVDKDRREALREIESSYSNMDVVVMDDAFQHRYVKAGLSVLLVDYNRIITEDKLLPYGDLREPASGKNRADIVVVTKCPIDLSPLEVRIIRKKLYLRPFQSLFFSTYTYQKPIAVFKEASSELTEVGSVLLVTAIAQPKPLKEYLEEQYKIVQSVSYSDHYLLSEKDWCDISERFRLLSGPNKYIFVTEKDAAKLVGCKYIPNDLKSYIYAIPLQIKILQGKQDNFNNKFIDYVEKNKRNIVAPKDQNKRYSKDWHNIGYRFG